MALAKINPAHPFLSLTLYTAYRKLVYKSRVINDKTNKKSQITSGRQVDEKSNTAALTSKNFENYTGRYRPAALESKGGQVKRKWLNGMFTLLIGGRVFPFAAFRLPLPTGWKRNG